MPLEIAGEVVGIFDLRDIPLDDGPGDDIRLRLEILRDSFRGENRLTVRVWRKEMYRIKPSFQRISENCDDNYSDEIVLVRDAFLEQVVEKCCGDDLNTVLRSAIEEIQKALHL